MLPRFQNWSFISSHTEKGRNLIKLLEYMVKVGLGHVTYVKTDWLFEGYGFQIEREV